MAIKGKKYFLFALVILLFLESGKKISQPSGEKKPLNIIIMIGDGMGLSQVTSSFYFGNDSSNFSRFKYIGLINTSSASHKITDSGAGATAFSIGKRTYNGAIGVGIDSLPSENMVEILSKKGYLCGLVATSSITHATPAAFYAHTKDRGNDEGIAVQLIHSNIDFFAASGIKYFNKRKDKINLFDTFPKYGFLIDTNSLSTDKQYDTKNKYGYLFYQKSLPEANKGRNFFLPNATSSAINYLSQSNEGFFLMVEGSQIDWAGHNNDADYLISEVLDFDKTIGIVLDFAKREGNTLVIVLADHETGGFTLAASSSGKDYEDGYNKIEPKFSTTEHSAALIPVFAFGPGAETFAGVYNNNEVFNKIFYVLDKKAKQPVIK